MKHQQPAGEPRRQYGQHHDTNPQPFARVQPIFKIEKVDRTQKHQMNPSVAAISCIFDANTKFGAGAL